MKIDFNPTEYLLQSVKTGQQFSDKGWTLDAPNENEPTLIRAVYEEVQINVEHESLGVFRFADWLPVQRFLTGSSAPATYKSTGLANHLGLENLYITFSGYWPEKNAHMRTCSFKETEAFAVGGRLSPDHKGVLVVASAGNTARAFARVCSDNNIPLLLCVPEDNLDALWFDEPVLPNVKLIATRSGSDYFDAIALSNQACALPGFFAEGGAKNVARRDGMGTTVLSATHFIGRIPDYYHLNYNLHKQFLNLPEAPFTNLEKKKLLFNYKVLLGRRVYQRLIKWYGIKKSLETIKKAGETPFILISAFFPMKKFNN